MRGFIERLTVEVVCSIFARCSRMNHSAMFLFFFLSSPSRSVVTNSANKRRRLWTLYPKILARFIYEPANTTKVVGMPSRGARVVAWNLTSAKVRLVEAPSVFIVSFLATRSFYRVPPHHRIIPSVTNHSPRPSPGYVLCKRIVESAAEGPETFRNRGSLPAMIDACIGLSDELYFSFFLLFLFCFVFKHHERG